MWGFHPKTGKSGATWDVSVTLAGSFTVVLSTLAPIGGTATVTDASLLVN